MKCVVPKPKDEDVELLIWEVHRIHQEGTFLEVKRVNAHSSKKAKQEMSLSERFATEGNEKADELVKVGAMLDGGEVTQLRASTTVRRKGEEGCPALQYAASFPLVEEWRVCEEL